MLAKTSKRFSSMPFRQADRFARNSPSAAPASSYKRFPGGGARGPNSADHPAQDLLYGKHVVSMALAWRPETCKKLYVQEGAPVQEAIQAASARNIPIEFCPKFAMNAMCDNRPHQGLLLDAASLRVQSLAEGSLLPFRSEPGKSQIVLVLDEIVDPANVGGILRSGYFFGVSGILSSEKNTAPISAVAAKASAGMSEVLASEGRLFSTRNLAACLEHHKPAGWRILGTAVERGASTLRDIPAAPLTLLVMGNEGFGLRTNIKARCDGLVHLTASTRPPIPARVPSDHPNAVAADAAAALRANDVSLNVTSAASALLARWQSQVVDGMDGW